VSQSQPSLPTDRAFVVQFGVPGVIRGKFAHSIGMAGHRGSLGLPPVPGLVGRETFHEAV